MKRKRNIIFLILIFWSSANFTGYAQNIDKLIPKNYKISQIECGQLNGDTLKDCAIIIANPQEMDSQELWVLLKNTNNSYQISFKTTNFITRRYENAISIENGKLILSTEHPWHGVNFCEYEFKYSNDVWVCLKASSTHDNGDEIGQRWDNEIDFLTGEYKISHTFTDFKNKEQTRQVTGKKINSVPPSILKKEVGSFLTVQHLKEKYYIFDRNDLWSETEINNLREFESELITGSWLNKYNPKIKIDFKPDGHFDFMDYNDKSKQFEILKGTFKIEGRTLTLNYIDRKAQKFSFDYQDQTWHIKKIGNFDFLRQSQD